VVDISNAFIQTRMEDDDEEVIMVLRGKLAELLVKLAPEMYRKYIHLDNRGQTVLYVKVLNALYGMLKAALMFYRKFVTDIKSIGFELNPYDPCMANKMINGKQFTIVWHVDDLKISHAEPKVVDGMIAWLKHKYEQLFDDGSGKMRISRGKIHEYLGMKLDFTTPGEVQVTMKDYIQAMVDDWKKHDATDTIASSPAAAHLFEVRDNAELLDEESGKVFHNFGTCSSNDEIFKYLFSNLLCIITYCFYVFFIVI